LCSLVVGFFFFFFFRVTSGHSPFVWRQMLQISSIWPQGSKANRDALIIAEHLLHVSVPKAQEISSFTLRAFMFEIYGDLSAI